MLLLVSAGPERLRAVLHPALVHVLRLAGIWKAGRATPGCGCPAGDQRGRPACRRSRRAPAECGGGAHGLPGCQAPGSSRPPTGELARRAPWAPRPPREHVLERGAPARPCSQRARAPAGSTRSVLPASGSHCMGSGSAVPGAPARRAGCTCIALRASSTTACMGHCLRTGRGRAGEDS